MFSKILNIATSLFYFTKNYDGHSLRNNKELTLPSYYNKPSDFGVAKDYIPLNQNNMFFISYPNNIRKDVRYKNGKYEEMINGKFEEVVNLSKYKVN